MKIKTYWFRIKLRFYGRIGWLYKTIFIFAKKHDLKKIMLAMDEKLSRNTDAIMKTWTEAKDYYYDLIAKATLS